MALPKERIGISLTELLKATMAGGLLFLLPVALVAIVLKQAMQLVEKDSKADFELPACRGSGRRLGRDSPRRSSADPGLAGRWPRRPHERWQAHYALV